MDRQWFRRCVFRLGVLLFILVLVACGDNDGNPLEPSLPVISSFTVEPSSIAVGGTTTLSWTVSGASSVSIDHGVGAVAGSSTTATPASTTTYTLTAANDHGSVTRKTKVVVDPQLLYLGQDLPGETPEIFAPALVSLTDRFEGRIAFSPDGSECYFSVDDATWSTGQIYTTRYVNGRWTSQQAAPFVSGFVISVEPFFSADGSQLFFTGKDSDSTTQLDIWVVARKSEGWGTPTRLPTPINSDANDYCFSQMADATMYFMSERSGSAQIYQATQDPGQPPQAELLPEPVLSRGTYEGDPAVAPDGHALVFYSGRPGGFGRVDLYVSFDDGNGGWTTPTNLGEDFNTSSDEYGATFSRDGKYLFFTRHDTRQGDIYWVASSSIEKFRP